MIRREFMSGVIIVCMLLALSACGNKGPLVPAGEEEQQKKEQQQTETGAE